MRYPIALIQALFVIIGTYLWMIYGGAASTIICLGLLAVACSLLTVSAAIRDFTHRD